LLAACGLVLDEQREVALVEFLEPIVPRYFFQRSFSAVARKIETNHADIVTASGAAYTGGFSVTFFGPAANLVVVGQWSGGCCGACHVLLLRNERFPPRGQKIGCLAIYAGWYFGRRESSRQL
jgi:hypothetical protein